MKPSLWSRKKLRTFRRKYWHWKRNYLQLYESSAAEWFCSNAFCLYKADFFHWENSYKYFSRRFIIISLSSYFSFTILNIFQKPFILSKFPVLYISGHKHQWLICFKTICFIKFNTGITSFSVKNNIWYFFCFLF